MTEEILASDFIQESNTIEGIIREPHPDEINMFVNFCKVDRVFDTDLVNAVNIFQRCSNLPVAQLRTEIGMDVFVGEHKPPLGGACIERGLDFILTRACEGISAPFYTHCEYETLHPFMDGNGRSGRLLWAWMMVHRHGWDSLRLKFLQSFYYQTLQESRHGN